MARQPSPSQVDITREDVDRFSLLQPLLIALHRDIQELAKKKQDGALTKTRTAMINRLLKDIKELLSKQPSSAYLDLLDEDSVPQNADALIVAGQYLAAMSQYFSKYTKRENYKLIWLTGQSAEDLED